MFPKASALCVWNEHLGMTHEDTNLGPAGRACNQVCAKEGVLRQGRLGRRHRAHMRRTVLGIHARVVAVDQHRSQGACAVADIQEIRKRGT